MSQVRRYTEADMRRELAARRARKRARSGGFLFPIWSGAPAPYDSAALAWELWVQGPYAGSPWSGEASAGGSGGRSLSEGTNPPTAGLGLNGLDSAHFDGANDVIGNTSAPSTFWAASAYSSIVLFWADASPAGAAATPYLNPAILSPGGDATGGPFLSVATVSSVPSITVGHYDGTWSGVAVAASLNAWHVAQVRYSTATDLEARIDRGSWSGLARGDVSSASPANIVIGRNNGSTAFFDGRVILAKAAKVCFDDDTFNSELDVINALFGTSF